MIVDKGRVLPSCFEFVEELSPFLAPWAFGNYGSYLETKTVIAICTSESPISRDIPPTVLRGDLIREEEPSVENSKPPEPSGSWVCAQERRPAAAADNGLLYPIPAKAFLCRSLLLP